MFPHYRLTLALMPDKATPQSKGPILATTRETGTVYQWTAKLTGDSRVPGTLQFLTEVLPYLPRPNNPITLEIYTTDDEPSPQPNPAQPYLTFASSRPQRYHNTRLIPDFIFHAWPECGIKHYTQTTQKIAQEGSKPYTDERLFWVGNPDSHQTRRTLVEDIAARDPRILARPLVWQRETSPYVMHGVPLGQQYTSLPDHTHYKYLLDVQGWGYSGRLKLLLWSQRPVFVQERGPKEYWHHWLEPYKHYIPVRHDLRNLSSQLDWAEQNPAQVKEIAQNAYEFAQTHLTKAKAQLYATDVLTKIIEDMNV